ncbi:MAG: hypothetical protein K6E22_11090 [Treponema sp.]|nr:hypothetical protein [Treponema sp.]
MKLTTILKRTFCLTTGILLLQTNAITMPLLKFAIGASGGSASSSASGSSGGSGSTGGSSGSASSGSTSSSGNSGTSSASSGGTSGDSSGSSSGSSSGDSDSSATTGEGVGETIWSTSGPSVSDQSKADGISATISEIGSAISNCFTGIQNTANSAISSISNGKGPKSTLSNASCFFHAPNAFDYNGKINSQLFSIPSPSIFSSGIASSIQSTLPSNVTEATEAPSLVGDPVFITAGKFFINDYDANFTWGPNNYTVFRNLVSGNHLCGSYGNQWFCSLDTRIIRGRNNSELEKIKAEIKKQEKEIKNTSNSISSISSNFRPGLRAELDDVKAKVKAAKIKLQKMEEDSIKNKELNKFSEWGYEDKAALLNPSSIIFIDDNGNIFILDYNEETNRYENCDQTSPKELYATPTPDGGIEIHYLSGLTKKFSAYGLPEYYRDRYGSTIAFSLDGSHRVKSIQHKGKTILSFSRNEKGFLTKISNELFKSQKNFYYDGNNLVKVVDEDNDIYQYEYDSDGDIKKCIKPDGNFNEIFYGQNSSDKNNKKVISVKNEEGWVETFDGDLSNGKLTYTDPEGKSISYYFEDENHITKEISSDGIFTKRTYDSNGKIATLENNYGITTFSYDEYGNLTKASYSDGTNETWTYQQPYNLLSSYRDRDTIVTTFDYDSNGFLKCIKRDGKTLFSYMPNNWGGIREITGCNNDSFEYDEETYALKKDKNGKYEYDSYGRLISYTNIQGLVWTWEYDGRTTIFRTPTNIERRVTMNSRKDITCKTESDLTSGKTKAWLFSYGKSHNIIEIKTGTGDDIKSALANATTKSTYEYTPSGKIKATYLWNHSAAATNDAPCIKTEYEYNSSGDITKETRYFVDENKKIIGNKFTNEFTYSFENGKKVIRIKKDGNLYATEFYNEKGLLVKKTDAEGRSSTNNFSPAGKLRESINPYGGITKYSYDSFSGQIASIVQDDTHIFDFRYGPDCRLASKTSASGFVTKYSYAENAGITTVTETTKNYVQKTEYDSLGRKKMLQKHQSNDGRTLVEEIAYDDKSGSATRKNGKLSYESKYDAWGNLLYDAETDKTFSYNEYNATVTEQCGKSRTHYLYNALGMISQIKDENNELNFSYDAKGNLLKQTDFFGTVLECEYDSFDRCISRKERGMPPKKFSCDGSGLIVKVFESDDLIQEKSYSKDMRTLKVRDALGNLRSYAFDSFGRNISETNALGKTKKTSYNIRDNSITTTDFNGNTSTQSFSEETGKQITKYGDKTFSALHYDVFGSIIKAETEATVQTYKYDESNMLILANDADKTTKYSYDGYGRVTRISLDGYDTIYSYDSSGNLNSAVSNMNKINFCYDNSGNENGSLSSNGVSVTKEKDEIGRKILTVQKDSCGNILFAEGIIYDNDGHIACTINSEPSFSLFEYDKHGRIQKQIVAYNKEIEEKTYREFEEYGERPSARPIYESVNFPKEFAEKAKFLCEKMNLDFTFSPQKSWIESYKYDLNGNRVSKSNALGTLNYEYDAENRLVRISGKNSSAAEFKYDDNGNLISENTLYKNVTLFYTSSNRLRESRVVDYRTENSFTESFTYDAFGRRQSIRDNTGCTVRSVYDGLTMNELCEYEPFAYSSGNSDGSEYTGESQQVRFADIDSYSAKNRTKNTSQTRCNITRYFTYANGRKIFQANSFVPKYSPSQSASYELTSDGRGSIRCSVAADGTSYYSVDYDADGTPYFANTKNGIKTRIDTATAVVSGADFAYAGKKYNAALGMYDYGFRDYSPVLARFTTSDPIRDGMNWYAYCAGDPVNFVDLWGLEAVATRFNQRDIGAKVYLPRSKPLTSEERSKANKRFGESACAATTVLNIVSEQYTAITGEAMTQEQAVAAMNSAIASGAVDSVDATTNFYTAANAMWASTGLKGSFTYTTDNPEHTVYCLTSDNIYSGKHFVNKIGNEEYYDVYSKKIGDLNAPEVHVIGIRGYDFSKNN